VTSNLDIRVNREECLKVERNFKLKKTAILVSGELENNLKQGLVLSWGVKLVTSPMIEESSHKFPQA
jgi:hypothetical protein